MYDLWTLGYSLIGAGLIAALAIFGPSIHSLMSRWRDTRAAGEVGVRQVSHQVPERVSVSAKPNTDDTERVPGARGASPDARAIVRASLIAELLDSGLLTNRDKAIMQVFRCSKAASTRPDAPFQVALRLVEQHRAKRQPEYVGEMVERVQREVAEDVSR